MTTTYSTNIVNEAVNVMTNIAIKVSQTCQAIDNLSQSVDVEGNSNLDVGSINLDQTVVTNISCVQSSNIKNQISQSIDSQLQQIADSITQALSFSIDTTDQKNLTNLLNNLKDSVTVSFTQNCINEIQTNQDVAIKNNVGKTNIGSINLNQSLNAVVNCVQNDQSVNSSKQAVAVAIKQAAIAKEESLLGPLFAILLILLVVFVVIVGGGAKALTNWKFLLVIGLIVVGYLILAAVEKWFPFR